MPVMKVDSCNSGPNECVSGHVTRLLGRLGSCMVLLVPVKLTTFQFSREYLDFCGDEKLHACVMDASTQTYMGLRKQQYYM